MHKLKTYKRSEPQKIHNIIGEKSVVVPIFFPCILNNIKGQLYTQTLLR